MSPIDQYVNYTLAVAALAVLVPYWDRMRQMSWSTHHCPVVGFHALIAIWMGVLAFHGMLGSEPVDWFQGLGIGAAVLWLCESRSSWRKGPPANTVKGHARHVV